MSQATNEWTLGEAFSHLLAFQKESAREAHHKRHHAEALPQYMRAPVRHPPPAKSDC